MSYIRTVRTDSWAKQLTQDQQRKLYEMTKQPNMNWMKATQWAVKEYGLKKIPSQSAFYQWRVDMCKEECRERAVAVAIATRRFCGLVTDKEIVDTFKVLATEAALNGDTGTAATFSKCAAMLHDCHIKQLGIDQKVRAWKTKVVLDMANNISCAPQIDQLLKATSLNLESMIAECEKKKRARMAADGQAAANPPAPVGGPAALTDRK